MARPKFNRLMRPKFQMSAKSAPRSKISWREIFVGPKIFRLGPKFWGFEARFTKNYWRNFVWIWTEVKMDFGKIFAEEPFLTSRGPKSFANFGWSTPIKALSDLLGGPNFHQNLANLLWFFSIQNFSDDKISKFPSRSKFQIRDPKVQQDFMKIFVQNFSRISKMSNFVDLKHLKFLKEQNFFKFGYNWDLLNQKSIHKIWFVQNFKIPPILIGFWILSKFDRMSKFWLILQSSGKNFRKIVCQIWTWHLKIGFQN